MVQQGQIDHLLQEAGEIPPPPHVVEQATMDRLRRRLRPLGGGPRGLLGRGRRGTALVPQVGRRVPVGLSQLPLVCGRPDQHRLQRLDRHLATDRRNKAALIWLGEDGTEQVYTYARLAQQVNRFANGLKSLGIGKGDRVVIYMPLTPEGAISMLACARIGAIHSVVYCRLQRRVAARPHPGRQRQGADHRRLRLPPRQSRGPQGHRRRGRGGL